MSVTAEPLVCFMLFVLLLVGRQQQSEKTRLCVSEKTLDVSLNTL